MINVASVRDMHRYTVYTFGVCLCGYVYIFIQCGLKKTGRLPNLLVDSLKIQIILFYSSLITGNYSGGHFLVQCKLSTSAELYAYILM